MNKLSKKFTGLAVGFALMSAAPAMADSMANEITVKAVSGGFVAKSKHESCTTDNHLVTTKNGLYFVTSAHTHFAYYQDKNLTSIKQIYKDSFGKMLGEEFSAVVSSMTVDEFRKTFKSKPPTEAMIKDNHQLKNARRAFMSMVYDKVDQVAKVKGQAYETKASKAPSPHCP